MKPTRKRFSPRVYAELIGKQHGLCKCGCGEPLEVGQIEWDHIIPLFMGGKDEPSNLQGFINKPGARHCNVKTREDMRKIAKVRRIEKKGRIRNATDREIAKILERRA